MKRNKPVEEEEEGSSMKLQSRLCDYCNKSTALIYCRADSAKLCFSCDKEVHSTNQLFAKHCRSQLCDACDDSPASVYCETEKTVLCQNCDWENHCHGSSGGNPSIHCRRPVEGFSGCPLVNELLAIFGFDDSSGKALILNEKIDYAGNYTRGFDGLSSDLALWETPEMINLNDLIALNGSGHNFRATEIPPLPKNRNAVCGKHKEEMLRQICELAKTENADTEPVTGFQFHMTEQYMNAEPYVGYESVLHNCISLSSSEVNELQYVEDDSVDVGTEFLLSCVEKQKTSSDINGGIDYAEDGHEEMQVPIVTMTIPRIEMNSQERDSAISRYKEKKKTRRYDKHIRYESRKVRAEGRTRIKGRFAKTGR